MRGLGLLAGIEFEMDDVAALVIASCGRRDLLAAYSMNNPKVVRIEPPLIIEESELERAISIIGESVAETAEMLDCVRAYDAAKASGEQAIPFEAACDEIEKGRL